MSKKLMIDFLGYTLASPLVLPAGIMGISSGSLARAANCGAGLLTTKSLSLKPRKGHNNPVTACFEGGMINAMGLCNPGIKEGLEEVRDFKKRIESPVIASVFGTSPEEFYELASYVNKSKADFIELNLSCPNVLDEFGIPLAASKDSVYKIVKSVKSVSERPVIAKLSPNVLSIKEIAMAAQNAGADALSMINSLGPGMLIDIKLKRPVLANKFGGVSGPCLKPVAQKLIYEASSCVKIPIIGMGGVISGKDVIEIKMAGATLAGIGAGVFYRGIEIFKKVNREIVKFLNEAGYENIGEVKRIK